MRPIRITGITGTSQVVPIDAYVTLLASVAIYTTGSGAQMQYTIDDVFNAAITPQWFSLGAVTAAANVIAQAPAGTRGIRCTGMVPADVLAVSQQSLQ